MIDTGCNTPQCLDVLSNTLCSELLGGRPITKVVVTHFHPDHIGLAGCFTRDDGEYFCDEANRSHGPATLITSRTTWHSARLLHSDNPNTPYAAHVSFMQRAGIKGLELESFKRRKPSRYSDRVGPLPESYVRIQEGDTLEIGQRQWTVRMGFGHADEHVTLWSDDNLAIVGDQILPAISPNLSIHFSEPNANCVDDWLNSCQRFYELANDQTICLPGHNRPFTGAPGRCLQLMENCYQVLDRIEELLSKPKTAIELMPDIYRRQLSSYERNLLIGETLGYLNYLHAAGRVECQWSSKTGVRWRRVSRTLKSNSQTSPSHKPNNRTFHHSSLKANR